MIVKFSIEGIECEGCIKRINNTLSKIKDITHYDLSLKDKTLLVEIKKEKIIKEIIINLNNLGFIATVINNN